SFLGEHHFSVRGPPANSQSIQSFSSIIKQFTVKPSAIRYELDVIKDSIAAIGGGFVIFNQMGKAVFSVCAYGTNRELSANCLFLHDNRTANLSGNFCGLI